MLPGRIPRSFAPRLDHDGLRLEIRGERAAHAWWVALLAVAGLAVTAFSWFVGPPPMALGCGLLTAAFVYLAVLLTAQSLRRHVLLLTGRLLFHERWLGPLRTRRERIALDRVRRVWPDRSQVAIRVVVLDLDDGRQVRILADGHRRDDADWLVALLDDAAFDARTRHPPSDEEPEVPDALRALLARQGEGRRS